MFPSRETAGSSGAEMRFLQVPFLLMLSCLPSEGQEQAMDVGGQVMDVGGGSDL